MRHCVVALALVCGASSTGVAQRVTVGPDVLAGLAGRDSGAPFGGVQARVQVDLDAFAGSIAYRWIGIGRTCKTSLPPICGIDTPGGQLFLVGVSRRVAGGTGTHLRGGMEIGVGRFLNNASTARDTRPLIGATLELRVPVGVGTVMIGGLVEWTRHEVVRCCDPGLWRADLVANHWTARRLRPLIVLRIASVHFAAALALGVLAFITQGSLTSRTPPTGAHGLISCAVAVLEFPLVRLVRVQSPERCLLTGNAECD